MKITVLDGFTLNPGDNSWDEIARLGDLIVHDRTTEAGIVERSIDSHILLTNKTPLSQTVLRQLPKLQLISVMATGHNVVDSVAARELGMPVCNVPVYGTETVAQFVMAALLNTLYRLDLHDLAIRNGEWQRRGDFSFTLFPLVELCEKTIGIIGPGRIGRATAKLATAFGMEVLAYSPRQNQRNDANGMRFVENVEELFERSDVVSLHCPLVPDTAELVNGKRLKLMKPTAILINSSRGGLVCEADLAAALNQGQLRAACLDVLSVEPVLESNPLLKAKNCFLTPHLAWATLEARRRLMAATADNVRAFLRGHPINVIN